MAVTGREHFLKIAKPRTSTSRGLDFGWAAADFRGGAQGWSVALFEFQAEAFEQRQFNQIFLPATGLLAGNDVTKVCHVKNPFSQAARPGLREAGDAVRGEH